MRSVDLFPVALIGGFFSLLLPLRPDRGKSHHVAAAYADWRRFLALHSMYISRKKQSESLWRFEKVCQR